jgi:N-methylhydantoinase A
MTWRVGVDVGGSFTDFAALNENDGRLATLKVFSRPDQPGTEIALGLRLLEEQHGIAPGDISYFTHGTTVGVNTVIQRNGVRLALLTTRHFEDVLELARLKIPEIHNLYSRRPTPLISRDRVFGIDERMNAQGEILTPVDRASVAAALEAARAAGAEGIVIALLHSWRNDANEQAVKAILTELAPDLPIFSSAAICPIIREYERTITASISGYVQPRVAHYLTRFEATLTALGVTTPPRINKSNGGVMGAAQAKAESVQMILSGTASGVIGAGFVAKHCGFPRLLSLDIGGTSADVAVLLDGEAEYGTGEVIGDFSIYIPSISVTSIGQGGGSIAWVDDFGVLKVGPRSAGSTPGPACYGRGGKEPTITDAFAVCGFLGHGDLGYSAVQLDLPAARMAVGALAERLSISLEETAAAIIELSVSSMYAETSGLISRFGLDPREFSLLAFGGAGPMLACFLARALNLQGVVVPPSPGVLSAFGGLVADLKNDFVRTLYAAVTPALAPTLRAAHTAMRQDALAWLHDDQGFAGAPAFNCSAEMRYQGQSFEVDTPLDPAWIEAGDIAAITAAFHTKHETLFGYADATAAVQLIALRLVISGQTPKPALPRIAPADGPAPVHGTAHAWMDGAHHAMPLYRREDLRAGHVFAGPAIVLQPDCTTCIPPDLDLRVDDYGNLVITRQEGRHAH